MVSWRAEETHSLSGRMEDEAGSAWGAGSYDNALGSYDKLQREVGLGSWQASVRKDGVIDRSGDLGTQYRTDTS